MEINDVLYGRHQIDGVLEELIKSAPVQRLKGVYQGGASFLVNPKWNVTRYEHSIGVMLLIKRLGGTIEEQIAGLLHDVSHTAFSHVIDFVFENEAEDYHENIFQQVIDQSEIPEILKQHGYDADDLLLNDTRWTLLEQPAPELCADRIDYTLRDMYQYGQITLREAEIFLDHLVVRNGRVFPDGIETAEWFVRVYYKEVIDFFMNPVNVYGYEYLAQTLKAALKHNVIAAEDLLKTDQEVLGILHSSENDEVLRLLEKIHPHILVKEDDIHYDFHRKTKMRLIDPTIFFHNEWITSSSVSEHIRKMGEAAYRKAKKGVYVKVIEN
ncbi:HD domain-containing protein [Bacillus mojavensis]|uniref:HD domain-containing protein n=1 Tax=Bacillus mojavensis TaxID=72360 RepID=UPI000288C40D|nr:HD domain-containing protein [Bacillus mojavensis]MCY9089291.1 HD domain-containing protein [Bacillus mojavensis]MDR4229165.1 HD domain-containing protein [Bacillus mojavensis]MEC1800787.1 HD domain-containing protein [Bacillus mojavensis]MEC3590233.1 HD domain-containing protein [Bacillus mojavensis]MEC5242622.1 HD domain-containing protein [Bacillus mojavensis]